MHTTDDGQLNELIERAQCGDQEAMAELFESYRIRLGRMVSLRLDHRVKNRVAVSDVLQEAFVDLARQLPVYSENPKLPFFLWMRRIMGQRLAKVHRAHLDQQKRNVAREFRIDNPMPNASAVYMADQLAGEFTSVSEQAMRNETQQRVQAAITDLSESDREMLALRHVEQLSNKEIAFELDISITAANNRYVRAIRRLRDALSEKSA